MITRKEIVDFFNKEAEVAKLNWESLMKLSVEDRVAKRKAIKDVLLDKEPLDDSDENYRRLRLNINKNLSDFKEGDPVVLHTDGVQDIKCTISNFEGDSSIIVEVFPPNLPNSLEPYYDVPLVLDKDIVDLRPSVYNNFTSIISSEEAYWHKSLINTKAKPKFENITECEVELEETCSAMGISLLPSQKEAIVKSMAAKDYYMIQGPPGTGKSQTITNIIAECLVDGKTVLFVSEKLAALSVVYDKLKKAGLEEFCLELHSHKANKKQVIEELCHTLKAHKSALSDRAQREVEIKREAQRQLDKYTEELHKIRPVINKSALKN